MQFSTIILAAVLTAISSSTVSANPLPNPEALATPAVELSEAESLVARQSFCTECKNGGKTCCSLTACYVYSC